MKQFFVAALMLLLGLPAVAQPSIEVVDGECATSTRHTDLVCKTEPESTATINGQQVHVYNTGCFGARVAVTDGDVTPVTVTATKDGLTTTRVINVEPAVRAFGSVNQPVMRDVNFTARTLPGAFLQYGNGTDRLGGSKMGFLDEGIDLQVVGDFENLYKVQLSSQRFAYIQKEYVKPSYGSVMAVNTSSITYSDQGKYDRVTLSLPCRLPYHAWTQVDPTTICVDVFGAMNNSNWISQHGTLGMIDYVDFRQVESDVFRVVIKLKKKYSWGYEVSYRNNTLTIDVKHTPSLNLKDLTIGLDAGHGGDAPGAIGNSGLTEATINLQLVNLVKQQLEAKGAKVVLSRSDDRAVTMAERKKTFKDAGVDLMLAIHNNSGGSPFEPHGSSTYYKHITNRALAATMLKHLVACGHKDAGLTGNFNISLNMPTEYPNALLEVLFMNSLVDEEMLCNPAHCKKIAAAIVAGLEDYLQQVKQDK